MAMVSVDPSSATGTIRWCFVPAHAARRRAQHAARRARTGRRLGSRYSRASARTRTSSVMRPSVTSCAGERARRARGPVASAELLGGEHTAPLQDLSESRASSYVRAGTRTVRRQRMRVNASPALRSASTMAGSGARRPVHHSNASAPWCSSMAPPSSVGRPPRGGDEERRRRRTVDQVDEEAVARRRRRSGRASDSPARPSDVVLTTRRASASAVAVAQRVQRHGLGRVSPSRAATMPARRRAPASGWPPRSRRSLRRPGAQPTARALPPAPISTARRAAGPDAAAQRAARSRARRCCRRRGGRRERRAC